jgi:Na+-transporting methylmalonyl-CoA/oxaloacetate decarboxylase gamma subunit
VEPMHAVRLKVLLPARYILPAGVAFFHFLALSLLLYLTWLASAQFVPDIPDEGSKGQQSDRDCD